VNGIRSIFMNLRNIRVMIAVICWADQTALRGIKVPGSDARNGLNPIKSG
jgi:hypothetical protein